MAAHRHSGQQRGCRLRGPNGANDTGTLECRDGNQPDGTNPSDFPEAEMNLDFGGVASYALFDFEVLCENTDLLGENCGLARYIIDNFSGTFGSTEEISPIPVPAAFWLFGTALIGIVGFSRRRKLG